MCFKIDEKRPNKLIAKRDITCYKITDHSSPKNRFSSEWQYFLYILGKLYKIKIGEPNGRAEIRYGFHSYSSKRQLSNRWWVDDDYRVVCIIPKNSEYYYNANKQQYVSNQIIIKGFI